MATVMSPKVACVCGACDCRHDRAGTYRRGFGSPYPFSLHSCNVCGLVRTYPVPTTSLYREGGPGFKEQLEQSGPVRPWNLPFADELLEKPMFAQRRGGRWLEVGANSGNLVAALRRHSVDIRGCDVDTVAVKVGRRPGVPLTVADLTEHPPDGEYDVILVVHTSKHVPDAAALIRNLAASLVPAGSSTSAFQTTEVCLRD